MWNLPLPEKIDIIPDGLLQNRDLERVLRVVGSFAGEGKARVCTPLFPDRVPAGQADCFAQLMARARVHDPTAPAGKMPLLRGEIEYEKRRISTQKYHSWGVLYDGFLYLDAIRPLVGDIHPNACMVVVTRQLVGTFDRIEKRYHARVAVYGFPSIISISGIVVAPARSRSYHLARKVGIPYEGDDPHLEHGDERLADVIAGLLLQALFFHMTGEAFCADERCRLFNAHTQRQLIRAQLAPDAGLCPRHEKIIDDKKRQAASQPSQDPCSKKYTAS